MLNSKFKTIFVSMHLEIILIVFYVTAYRYDKAYDNTKPIKIFFQIQTIFE